MSIHYYTKDELEFLREFAPGHSYKEITEAFNERFPPGVDERKIKACLGNHKITTGRTGRFEKGHIPANKGMHQPIVGRMAETQFKKGNIPPNHKPVGTMSIRSNDKKGQKYVYEKVAEPNKWRLKHILEWERHNGPVPKGKVIIFADGNSLNADISNLVMIDRSQLAVMNRWNIRGNNKELTETAANIASLKMQISEAKKKRKKG